MENYNKTAVEIISRVLKERGLNQRELASLTGLAENQISRILRGESGLGIQSLVGISRALRISIYDLIGKKPSPTLYDVIALLKAYEAATPEAQNEALAYLKKHAANP